MIRLAPNVQSPFAAALASVALMTLACFNFVSDASAQSPELTFVEAEVDGQGSVTGMTEPGSVSTSTDGRNVYLGSEEGVLVFSRQPPQGELEFGQSIALDSNGQLPKVSAIALSNNGKTVAVALEELDAVALFDADPSTGALTPTGQLRNGVDGVEGLDGVSGLAFARNGRQLYATGSKDGTLAVFTRKNGNQAFGLAQIFSAAGLGVPGLSGAKDLAIGPNGKHLYVAGQLDGALVSFSRSANSGELNLLETLVNGEQNITDMDTPTALAFSPDGQNLYVASADNDALVVFERDKSSGKLIFLESHVDGVDADGLGGASGVAAGNNGKRVYVTGPAEDAVSVFERDTATGRLIYLESVRNGPDLQQSLDKPQALALTNNGQSLYVAAQDANALVAFSVTPTAPDVLSALAPTSRSVRTDETATAFLSIINATDRPAEDCLIAPENELAGTFSYQTTDPLTNVVTGDPNAPTDVPSGGAATFVVALTLTEATPPTEVTFLVDCANTGAAPQFSGVNSLLLSSSEQPVADIVAVAATAGNDGIVWLPGANGIGAFSLAAINLGAADTLHVSPETAYELPIELSVCETDSESGQCLETPASALSRAFETGEVATFSILIRGLGSTLPVDLASSRVNVEFRDNLGLVRGAAGVAVQTAP